MNSLTTRVKTMTDGEIKRVFKELDNNYNNHTDDERILWDYCFDEAWQRDIIRTDNNGKIIYNPNK